MTQPLLEVHDLRVSIDTRSGPLEPVQGVSVSVDPGEIVGVVGESGCGKSTLLRAIAGVTPRGTRVTGGSIVVNGRSIRGGEQSADLAMIFQDPMTSLNPVMRVGDQIAEVPRRRDGIGKTAARDLAIDLMAEVGIPSAESRWKAYPHQLSGGLRQRVLIAAALSGNPELLLCDEPTTALDVTVQAQLVNLLRRLCEDRQLGILYVTHDLPLIGTLCRRLNVMYAGQVMERGRAESVLRHSRHPYTRALLEAAPRIGDRLHRLDAIPGHPPRLTPGLVGCPFLNRCTYATTACAHSHAAAPDTVLHETGCLRAEDIEWPTVVRTS